MKEGEAEDQDEGGGPDDDNDPDGDDDPFNDHSMCCAACRNAISDLFASIDELD